MCEVCGSAGESIMDVPSPGPSMMDEISGSPPRTDKLKVQEAFIVQCMCNIQYTVTLIYIRTSPRNYKANNTQPWSKSYSYSIVIDKTYISH